MNIPKAIELNEESERSLRDHKFIDHADAIKLGNQALKRIVYLRKDMDCPHWMTLPGETDG